MAGVTDLPFTIPDPDPTRPERKPAKCRRHVWIKGEWDAVYCERCKRLRDVMSTRRNRNNRKRGVSDELAVAVLLGGRKVGPLGLPWDVEVEGYLRAQCKKLARWPSVAEIVTWLDAIPSGPELRAVTLADTPGPGGKVRRLIVMDAAEFAAWHGRAK